MPSAPPAILILGFCAVWVVAVCLYVGRSWGFARRRVSMMLRMPALQRRGCYTISVLLLVALPLTFWAGWHYIDGLWEQRDSVQQAQRGLAARAAAAADAGPDDLAVLASDPAAAVRAAVAANISTPPQALTALAEDTDPQTRLAVAAHPSTPGEALTALAEDTDIGVRHAVLSNPSAPDEASDAFNAATLGQSPD